MMFFLSICNIILGIAVSSYPLYFGTGEGAVLFDIHYLQKLIGHCDNCKKTHYSVLTVLKLQVSDEGI